MATLLAMILWAQPYSYADLPTEEATPSWGTSLCYEFAGSDDTDTANDADQVEPNSIEQE